MQHVLYCLRNKTKRLALMSFTTCSDWGSPMLTVFSLVCGTSNVTRRGLLSWSIRVTGVATLICSLYHSSVSQLLWRTVLVSRASLIFMWAFQAVGGRSLHCSVLSVTSVNALHLLLRQFDCSRRFGLKHNILQVSPLVLQVHSTSFGEAQCWPVISNVSPNAASFHLCNEHCNFCLAPSSYPPTPVAQAESSQ